MSEARRAYLAGPDVFLPDAVALGAAKKRICAAHGLLGVFPLDGPFERLAGLAPAEAGLAAFDVCVELMDSCDLAIANMTPFRGPSMDVGTAIEMGYMHGRGKPVYGYTNVPSDYAARVAADGLFVEPYGLSDNLMAPGVVARSSGTLPVRGDAAGGRLLRDLEAFETCVRQVANALRREGAER